jgi:ubiquitin conjugation factor E4 B
MSNAQGQRLIFLPGLNEELNEAGSPLKLSVDVLEQAIMEAANTWPHDKPLMGYLLPCWKRAIHASSTAKTATGARQEVHEEAKRLCMSNCLFALTMPDLYGLENRYVSWWMMADTIQTRTEPFTRHACAFPAQRYLE